MKVLMEKAVKLADTVMVDYPGRISNKWQYDAGLTLMGFDKLYHVTGLDRYRKYIDDFFNHLVEEDGTIKTYLKEAWNLDNLNCGKNLFDIYKRTSDEKYRIAIETLASQAREQPVTESGVYWHKKIYPNQIWLDGIFMGEPFIARYAQEFDHPELYDKILHQFVVAEEKTYEPRCGLYAHGCDESKMAFWADKNTGRSLNVWGRACGWYSMALVDTLDYIPKEREDIHNQLVMQLNKLMSSVIKYQSEEGVWYQVLDNRRNDNFMEATCTCQFAYTLEKGIRLGYLEPELYSSSMHKAVNGILKIFWVEQEGKVYITNCCTVAGLGPENNPRRNGTLDYYFNELIGKNDLKAVGPFLMMATTYDI